jgi:hypothetical protein
MALLYILTGHDKTDNIMRNLDLQYMSPKDYGIHIEQYQHAKPVPVDLDKSDRYIHVLAHGDQLKIADETGDKFAGRLIATFGKEQLKNRTVLIYACNVAEGGGGSVLDLIVRTLKNDHHLTKVVLVGSVDQTFTRSKGTMMVLKNGENPDKLSKDVEGKGGKERDAIAEPYLRAFRQGWRGYKIFDNGELHALDAEAAGAFILDLG